ncbi:thiamine-phosphate kinase [candidate division KSB1 bacterium]
MVELSHLSELELIERLRAVIERDRRRGPDVLPLGIGDDTSILAPPAGDNLLFTIDTMVEGTHFRLDLEPADDLGFKLIAVNASDIAAMGGRPTAALVSLALPGGLSLQWFDSLAEGLRQGAERFDLDLLGGDTTRSPATTTLSVTMLGRVPKGEAIRRDRAGVGDVLLVTGDLGKGRAGREALIGKVADHYPQEVASYLRPCARVEEGTCLARVGKATAMIDISDGLASETYHLARMSGVAIELDGPAVPLPETVRRLAHEAKVPAMDYALFGGEDYELLAAVPPERVGRVVQEFETRNLARLSPIGRVTAGEVGVWLIDDKGERKPMNRLGYGHFGEHRIET